MNSGNQALDRTMIAASESSEVEIDLVGLLFRLLEKWKIILLVAILFAVVLGLYNRFIVTPLYEATSQIYVLGTQDSVVNLSELQIGAQLTQDYVDVLQTWEVREQVLQNLNLDYTYKELARKVDITVASSSRILAITATSPDPQEAMTIANEYARVAQDYISLVMKQEEPTLLSKALLPTLPANQNTRKYAVIGFLIGAVLVIGIYAVLYVLDDKIRTPEDIQRATELPTLTVIPTEKDSDMGGMKL